MWVAENNVIKADDGRVVAIVAKGFVPSHIVELHNWWEQNHESIEKWRQDVKELLEK